HRLATAMRPAAPALPRPRPSPARQAIEQASPARVSHLTPGLFRFRPDSPRMGWVAMMRACLCSAAKSFGCWVQKSALPILLIFLTSVAAAAQSIPGHPDLKALFAVVGRMHNIDADLLEAMAEVESGGDPLSVSPKGALGL